MQPDEEESELMLIRIITSLQFVTNTTWKGKKLGNCNYDIIIEIQQHVVSTLQ